MGELRKAATGLGLAFAIASVLGAATSAAAQGVPIAPRARDGFPQTTLYFTAPCADCSDALGILTIADYVSGALMGNSHFVEFKYTSSKLNLDITAADFRSFRALFTEVPGENYVQILGPDLPPQPFSPPRFPVFETDPSYTDPNPERSRQPGWLEYALSGSVLPAGVGSDVAPDDYGTHFTWSAVDPRGDAAPAPEPASWALMIAGFGLAGEGLRAARRTSAAA